jgi:hypothetical protein
MRTFIYIIGSMDDFSSYEELEAAYNDGTLGGRNASVHKFQLRADCGTNNMTVKDIAMLVGRGLAFGGDWCMDGTFGDLIEVE